MQCDATMGWAGSEGGMHRSQRGGRMISGHGEIFSNVLSKDLQNILSLVYATTKYPFKANYYTQIPQNKILCCVSFYVDLMVGAGV